MHDPIFDIFREEAQEHLAALERGLLDLESVAEDAARSAVVHELFRHAHSLKGDSRAIGLPELQAASQKLEDLLDHLRDRPSSAGKAEVDSGLQTLDNVRRAFQTWLTSLEEAAPAPAQNLPADTPPGEESAATPAEEESPAASEPAPRRDEGFTVRVPSERLDRLLSQAAEVRIVQRSALKIAEQLEQLRSSFQFVASGIGETSPHDSRRDLEGALDQMQRLQAELHKQQTREILLADSLERDIRSARLLPLAVLADSYRRAVRELAQSLGKPIRYEVKVGSVLLDKAVIEALKDPLLHLIRNAADHGIESPADRRAAGKPADAVIRVDAERQGDRVRITVSDDGRGLQYDRIRQRLRELGSDPEVDHLTEAQLGERLFLPGFSTAARGDVSGRGVGLDVVRNAVERLQGGVSIDSSNSAGTTFALTVPVSISTIRIVSVLWHGQHYGIPSAAVIGAGRVRSAGLRELEGRLVLPLSDEAVPWVQLGDVLNQGGAPKRPEEDAFIYLLIARRGKRVAIAVDDLEEETEVLLKPLGFPLTGMPGILGGSVRSDGSVQIILDLTSPAFGPLRPARRAAPVTRKAARILVVDDSRTTRAIMRNVFAASGYEVQTASDGLDALERLRRQPADLVVSDVEMPRLNGIDLTRQIKAKYGLPVILVTAREQEAHRREGLDAGADAYFVKSTFQGAGLLEIVQQFV